MKLSPNLTNLLLGTVAATSTQKPTQKPNILFIFTDDQGQYNGGMDTMPKLQELLVQKGTTYPNHYCSVALCCPSRANLWTGRMPHNTNVTDVTPPYGGYPKVVQAGWNDNYLPLWMQDAGYDTYYVGKLWNAQTVQNYNKPYAKGFNGSDFLLDPYTYRYYYARMTRNGHKPVNYDGQYSTDVIAGKAEGFLDEAFKNPDRPWMLTVAPNAPHANGSHDPSTGASWFGAPEYAPRHSDMFKDYMIPRDDSFNKPVDGAVSWIKSLPELDQQNVDYIDEFQRCRLRALQAVDEMIGRLVDKLDQAGVLDNTYIFYSTDNGYHVGQHRMQPGKNCAYDTDIHIPLIARGPGIPENQTLDIITSHTDLAPTFLSIAGTTRPGLDGQKIPVTPDTANMQIKTEHVAIEYWGRAVPEGIYGYYSNSTGPRNSYRQNTYKGVRLIADSYSLYYSVWCTNEKEFYNLIADPHQTVNYAANPDNYSNYTIAGRKLPQIMDRLDALMMVLKSCEEDECRFPWQQLHPDNKVHSLPAALHPSYDQFYANQPKVSFETCDLGYHPALEGPQQYDVYGRGKNSKRDDGLFGGYF